MSRRPRHPPRHQPNSIPTAVNVVRHDGGDLAGAAFGSGSERFSRGRSEASAYTPGPGAYDIDNILRLQQQQQECIAVEAAGLIRSASPSHSRKGYGVGFVSKTKRFDWDPVGGDSNNEAFVPSSPGPGSYNTQAAEQALRKGPKASIFLESDDFDPHELEHRKTIARLRAARARASYTPWNVPGPGTYNTAKASIDPDTTSRTYASAFKSSCPPIVDSATSKRRNRNKRGKRIPRSKGTPAPGAYYHPIEYSKRVVGKDGNERGTWTFASSFGRGMVRSSSGPPPSVYASLQADVSHSRLGSSSSNSTNNAAASALHNRSATAPKGARRSHGLTSRLNTRAAHSSSGEPQQDLLGGGGGGNAGGRVEHPNPIAIVAAPGPGSYNVARAAYDSKDLRSAFKSRTKRNMVTKHQRAVPGPAFYQVNAAPVKRSFLLNAGRKWV
jgi:hypothetical protein